MADPQKTADEIRAAAERRRLAEMEAALAALNPEGPSLAVPAGADPLPPVPLSAPPSKLDDAQVFAELMGALEGRQSERQHGSSIETGAKAGQLAEDYGLSPSSAPQPLPAERSWADQFVRTFGQQIIRGDEAPASAFDRVKAAAAAGIDMNPFLRAFENPLFQAAQAQTAGMRDAKSDGTIAGNITAGLQRGVSRGIDAMVPDNTTGESVTGVRTQGNVEALDAIGSGVAGIGRVLQTEVAGEAPGRFETQKAKAGLALEALGRAARLPQAGVESLNSFTGHQPPAEPGMLGEPGTLTLLRYATAPMAAAAEAGKAVPVPLGTKSSLDALGLRKDMRPPLPADASFLDKAKRVTEPVTLGEMIGVPSGAFQQIDRSKPSGPVDQYIPAPMRNYTQAVLERIEKQQGLEAEGEAIATQLGGEQWRRTGFVLGAIVDAWVEPERFATAVLGKGAKLARRTVALGEVAPDMSLAQRAVQAASQPTVDAGKVYGGQFTEALRTGKVSLDDLPPAVRAHADDIAAERQVLLEEQLALDGLAPMPTTVGEAGRARQAMTVEQVAAAEAVTPMAEIERLRAVAMEASARAAAAAEAYKGALRGPARRPDPEVGPGPLAPEKVAEAKRAQLDAEAAAAERPAKTGPLPARRPDPEAGPGPVDREAVASAKRAQLDATAAAAEKPAKPGPAPARRADPEEGPGPLDREAVAEAKIAARRRPAAIFGGGEPPAPGSSGVKLRSSLSPDLPPVRRPDPEAGPGPLDREAAASARRAARRKPGGTPVTPEDLLLDLGDAREAARVAAADLSAAMKRRRDAAAAVVEVVPRKSAPKVEGVEAPERPMPKLEPRPKPEPEPEVVPRKPAPKFEPAPAPPSETVGVRLGEVPRVQAEVAAERAARAEAAVAEAVAKAKVAAPKAAAATKAPLLEATAPYVVRNVLEDELHVTADLADALDWMRERGIEGDRVWTADAPIATWAEDIDGWKIRPTTKAGGYNAGVLTSEAERPAQKLRSLFTPEQHEVGNAAASALAGMAPGRVGDLPSEQIIRDAYARWALDRTGAAELTFLPTMAQVTHADRARIMRQVDADLRELGAAPPAPTVGMFGAKRTSGQVTDGGDVALIGRTLTEDEQVQVAKLANRYRMKVVPDITSTKGLRDLRMASIAFHGGAIASARSAVRGAPGLVDALQTAMETLNTDRQVRSKAVLAVRPLIAPLLDAFVSSPLAGLSPTARAAVLRGRSRLERLADEVLGGLRAEIGTYRAEKGQRVAPLTPGQMSEVFRRVLGDDLPVAQQQMDLVAELRTGAAMTDEAIKEIAAKLKLPKWATTDELVRSAVSEWAARTEARAAEWGADYLRSVAATGGLGVKPGDAVATYIAKNRERLLQVYDEVFLQGRLDGDAVQDAFARLGAGPAGSRISVNTSPAMLAFLVTRRRAEVLGDTLADLERAGVVVSKAEYDARGMVAGGADPHVFSAVLGGTTTTTRDGLVQELYSPGAKAWARRRAARMGIEPGAGPGEDLVSMAADGRTFMVPRYLHKRLMSSLTAGKVSPVGLDSPTALTLTGSADAGAGGVLSKGTRAFDAGTRFWKSLQTSGAPALPSPKYALAQAIGVLQAQWSTRGVVEMIKTAPDVAKSVAPTRVRVLFPDIVSQMMGRLSAPDDVPLAKPPLGARRFLRDANGMLHSVDDLTDAARQHGLSDTLLSFETARHLESLLFSEMTLPGRAMFGPAAYTEMVTDWMGGFDQAARLSTFLREVEKGTPVADAAKLARQSALDFRDLTDFEATWMRRAFTWYALQRKTADTLIREGLRNPGRITSQMRLAHNLATDDITVEQQGALVERDVGSLWLGKGGSGGTTTEYNVNQNRVNPRWYWRAKTPPVQIPEYLSNLAWFLTPPVIGVEMLTGQGQGLNRVEDWAGSLHPLVDAASIAVSGKKRLGAGANVEELRNSVVMPIFMDLPFGSSDVLVDMFDIAPVSLRSPALERSVDLEEDPSASEVLGEPAVWVVAAGDSSEDERVTRRRMWAEFMLFMSSQGKSATGLKRTVGAMPPRPDLTWEQEAAWAIGLEYAKRPTTQEVVDQFRIDREQARKRETRAQQDMTGE